jgi:hypothetical protein
MSPTADDFRSHLSKLLAVATELGFVVVDVNAGKLHRVIGGYLRSDHRMPVCDVMRQAMKPGDEVVTAPRHGQGARLTIRYWLPRIRYWLPRQT